MGDLNEQAAFGSSLGVDSDRGADVASRLNILSGVGRNRQVDGWVRESASVGAAEEVLDQGAEVVQFVGGRVPSEEGIARVGLECQSKHVLLVLDVDFDLVFFLSVGDGEA